MISNMTSKTFALFFLACLAALPVSAENADFVKTGGVYKGGSNFNNAKNPYSYMPTTGSIAEISRKQYEENRKAYLTPKPNVTIKPSKPLLELPDDKKAKCLTGNYDDCR